jgi:hypothetical protein
MPEEINRGLTELYMVKRAMTRWDGPAFPNYSTRAARVCTFQNWPYWCTNLTPAALSEAGFFCAGKTLVFLQNIHDMHVHRVGQTLCLQYLLF